MPMRDVTVKESIKRVVLAHRKRAVSNAHSTALMKWMSNAVKRLGSRIGDNVYVVGGAVRNFVIDQPVKDVDMVIDTEAAGRDSVWLAKKLAKMIPATTEIITDGYGVGKIKVTSPWVVDGVDLSDFSAGGDAAIEIANARSETYSDDTGGGYKPSVSWSGIDEDVLRRDFTFNTLMWRLSDLANGPDKAEIIDMTGCGIEDLKAGEARCPLDPDTTFHDDPTRMLRAIKFLVKYKLKIPNDTAAAIRRKRMSLLKVSPSRTWNELVKLLNEKTWKQTLDELDRLGLIEPLKILMQKDKQFSSSIKNVAAKLPVSFFIQLTDLGLPIRHELSWLDAPGRKRVSDLAFSMSREEQDEFVAALVKPGNAIKDKSFYPSLAKDRGLSKKEIGQFMGRMRELSRKVILDNPDLISTPNALKQLIKRESERMRLASLLPVMSPWFNVREIIKQCLMLEDHLFQPRKRCPDCISKHFLTIEAFLEEAVTLDKTKSLDFDAAALADRIRLFQTAWVEGVDPEWLAQGVRSIRKSLHPQSLLSIREAQQLKDQCCIHTATKSHGENEDEQTERLVKKSPKKKPPRKDLKKERVDVEADPDMEDLGAEGDRDLSLNYKRVAALWLQAAIEKTDGGKFKATKGDRSEYFATEDEAKAWLNDEDPDEEPEGEESEGEESGSEEEAPSGEKQEQVEINSDDDIPEALSGFIHVEDFADEDGKPMEGMTISGPAEGKYRVTVEHGDGTSDSVTFDPDTDEGLQLLLDFPETVAKNRKVKDEALASKQRVTRKKLHERLDKLLPELAEKLPAETFIDNAEFDHDAFNAAYDKQMEVFKKNPMSISEARVALSGEAAAEMFEANEDKPVAEILGEIIAHAEYAKETHFNPAKDLAKPNVRGDLTKDERFAQMSSTLDSSMKYSAEDREVLVLALQAEREGLADDKKRAKEIDARIEAHQLCAVIKGHKVPAGNEPTEGAAIFIRKMAESEDGRAILCSPSTEWGTQEVREAMKSALESVPDDDFPDMFEEGTPARQLSDYIANAKDPDERKMWREAALTVHMDNMTVYEPLLDQASDSARKEFNEKSSEYVGEMGERVEEDFSGALGWLRQMLSSLVAAIFGDKDKDKDTSSEKADAKATKSTWKMLADKVRTHADNGDADTLSQKTKPTSPALFGGVPNKEK